MLTHDTALRTQGPVSAPPPPSQEPVAAPLTPPVQQTEAIYANPPEDVSYFYNDLSPYGSWVQLEGVGWCWQPRAVVINRGWSPYCDSGHWVYSDCGWYWASDYSWGWAPFHYGRWHLHDRCGWVWLPDRVWGPAWVTWRFAGDRCGWAPLPPLARFDIHSGLRFNGVSVGVNFDFGLRPNHFTFVSMHDFADRDLGHHRLAQSEVRTVFKQTTIVNNLTVVNNTVVNHGIPVDRVASATHREFHPAAVRDFPAQPGNVSGRFHATTERNSSVVYRTQLRPPPRTPAVAVQKVDDRHPVIQHTAIAPGRVDYRSTAGRTTVPYSPAASPRRYETPASQAPRRGTEASPVGPQSRPEPRTYPSAPSAPSAPSSPPAPPSSYRRDAAVSPNASSGSTAIQRRPNTAQTDSVSPNTSSRSSTIQRQPYAAQTESRGGNPHVYYPKTYHQSAESRPMPQASSRHEAAPAPSSRGDSSDHHDHSSKHDR